MGFWVPLMKPVYNGMYCWLLGGWARRRGLEVLGGAGFLAQGTISPDKHQQFELGCRNILELSRSIGDELYYVHSSQSNQKLCSLFMKTRR